MDDLKTRVLFFLFFNPKGMLLAGTAGAIATIAFPLFTGTIIATALTADFLSSKENK